MSQYIYMGLSLIFIHILKTLFSKLRMMRIICSTLKLLHAFEHPLIPRAQSHIHIGPLFRSIAKGVTLLRPYLVLPFCCRAI